MRNLANSHAVSESIGEQPLCDWTVRFGRHSDQDQLPDDVSLPALDVLDATAFEKPDSLAFSRIVGLAKTLLQGRLAVRPYLEAVMDRRLSIALGRASIRLFTVGAVLLGIATPARATSIPIDPIGFCPPPATMGSCTTATGYGGETIGVGTTSVGMMKNGNGGTAVSPWELLVAVPNDVGGAPAITFASTFTQSSPTVDKGEFLPTTSGDIYAFAGTTGDTSASLNAANLFCDGASYPCTTSNEITAFGSLPTFFEIFVYAFTPEIADNTPYVLNIGGSGLTGGTYLAGTGGDSPFSTPFTVAGLVNGPGCTDCIVTTQATVPEPASLALFGSGLALAASRLRKKRSK
jgi:hypothetical protein